VNHHGDHDPEAAERFRQQLQSPKSHLPLDAPELRDELLPALLQKSQRLAKARIESLIARSRAEMKTQLEYEISRLQDLRKVNSNVTEAEIESLIAHERELDQRLAAARLRLDAIRLILP
jgi:ATP-dependent helicase HepA